MSTPHIEDGLLDQYALGTLPDELLAPVEEHMLLCGHCQSRLKETDEFIGLFRAAATQPDARPQSLWQRLFPVRTVAWTAAAALAAMVLLFVSVESRKSPTAPAVVFMQALRGPDAGATTPAGKPARLIFDVMPSEPVQDYQAQIVNLNGDQVLAGRMEWNEGHLSLLVEKLDSGSYWVRIYRGANRELIAEYGLRAE